MEEQNLTHTKHILHTPQYQYCLSHLERNIEEVIIRMNFSRGSNWVNLMRLHNGCRRLQVETCVYEAFTCMGKVYTSNTQGKQSPLKIIIR